MRLNEIVRSLDWVLAGATLLLVFIGLAMLFSSSAEEVSFTSRFVRQLAALGVATGASLVVMRLPYHVLRHYALVLYAIGLGGLVFVFFAARVIRGAASRLELIGFQIQPSEFMKVAVVIMLAWMLARTQHLRWPQVLGVVLIVALPVGLILLEPDTGTAALLIGVGGMMLIFAGLAWWAIVGLGLVGVGGLAAAWLWLFAEYQKERLIVFLDPSRDPLGAGYNVVQSMVALGSGRIFGRGLGHGPQSQLQFLPERHTDFVLASIGEELGFIGVAVVIALYVIVLWRMLKISRSTQDTFGRMLAVGSFALLLVSFMVSAGMNMGLLPITGIPLPLLSYGGSNLVTTFLLLAVVQSVHLHSKWVQAPVTEISHLT